MKESVPFFVNSVAVTLGFSLDILALEYMVGKTDPKEVGLYGAAKQIANLSALLSPIMGGVLIPLMRRAHARSEDEFFVILRRVIEGVVVVALPLTLILALGADVALHYALRDEYLPAAGSLRALAPTFVFAYGNVLLWLALMIMGRSWQITMVSIVGLGLLVVLTLIAVPLTRPLGLGGAGMGTGIALSLREAIIIVTFLLFIGKRALDARNIGAVLKSALICVVVTATHLALGRVLHTWPQLVLRVMADCALYGALLLGLRVVRIGDAKSVLKLIKNRRNA
jgi:O-antigen/teichoic acid export membrane protein